MCQLTYIDSGNKEINKILLLTSLSENSRDHKDGTGFFNRKSGIHKVEYTAYLSWGLGKLINHGVVDSSPIIGHVRQASFGNKVINIANAHPFETEKLVLAHNGTLTKKTIKTKEETELLKDKIDSEVFLYYLDKEYDGKDLPNALIKTMKDFTGKFAFLIYSKTEDKFYAVRGKTAKLHTVEYQYKIGNEEEPKKGIIINTDENDLVLSLVKTKQILNLKGYVFGVNFPSEEKNEPVLLKEETIFEIFPDGSLKEVGEIKENENYTYVTKTYDYKDDFGYHNFYSSRRGGDFYERNKVADLNEDSKAIAEFISSCNISFMDMDKMFYLLFDVGICNASPREIEFMVKIVIPRLKSKIEGNKKLLKNYSKIVSSGYNPYIDFGFVFPYMMEDPKSLREKMNLFYKTIESRNKKLKEENALVIIQ